MKKIASSEKFIILEDTHSVLIIDRILFQRKDEGVVGMFVDTSMRGGHGKCPEYLSYESARLALLEIALTRME